MITLLLLACSHPEPIDSDRDSDVPVETDVVHTDETDVPVDTDRPLDTDRVDTDLPVDTDPPDPCGTDFPQVGMVAPLVDHGHGITGEAEIVNGCTIVVRHFSFDGRGPDVQWYLAQNSDFANGFVIGLPLTGHEFDDQTVRIELPEGRTLDEFNSISVWCVRQTISFGDGVFAAP